MQFPYSHLSFCFSVKRREVLTSFTATTLSTSCSTTMPWWPWWLKIFPLTWKQWDSCLKVHDCYENCCSPDSLFKCVCVKPTVCNLNVSSFTEEQAEFDPQTVRPGSRYSHVQEVQERLNFLRYVALRHYQYISESRNARQETMGQKKTFVCLVRFLLKDGQLWLCAPQAKQIWKCLAENAVFLCDREACFKWYTCCQHLLLILVNFLMLANVLFFTRYSKLMGDEPDLDPDINKDFFENNVLQLDPSLLTENGMKCFERFFKAVNCREGKLVAKRRAYMMDDLELIGLDYLWRVCTGKNFGFEKKQLCQLFWAMKTF